MSNPIREKIEEIIYSNEMCEATNSTGLQMYSYVCNAYKLESVDIEKDYDFIEAYKSLTGEALIVPYYLSIFQSNLYLWMMKKGHGTKTALDLKYHSVLVMQFKLRDKIISEQEEKPINHTDWLH